MRIHKMEVIYHNLVGFPVSTLIFCFIQQYYKGVYIYIYIHIYIILYYIYIYITYIQTLSTKQELQWSVEVQAATDEKH